MMPDEFESEQDGARGRSGKPGDAVPLFGRFELLQILGRGAVATVYRALDRRTGSEVALKVGHAHLSKDQGDSTPSRELLAGIRLNHPNIARIFEHGYDDENGVSYLVLELVRGEPLSTAASKLAQPERPAFVRAMMQQILDALDHAHGQGVLHRDIKPSNILVTSEGTFKLVDFSSSKVAEETRPESTGGFHGTFGFAAPEVVDGHAVTPQSDLYSLGFVGASILQVNGQNEGRASRRSKQAALVQLLPLLDADPAKRPSSAATARALLTERGTRRHIVRAVRKIRRLVPRFILFVILCRAAVEVEWIRVRTAETLIRAQSLTGTDLLAHAGTVIPALRNVNELARLSILYQRPAVLDWVLSAHEDTIRANVSPSFNLSCYAASLDRTALLRMLVEKGYPLNSPCHSYAEGFILTTAAALALQNKSWESYQILKSHGAKLLISESDFASPVLVASIFLYLDKEQIQQVAPEIRVFSGTNFSSHPAAYAIAARGDRDVLRMAVERGLNPNVQMRDSGGTLRMALHTAVEQGHAVAVETLLSLPETADNLVDDLGRTAVFRLEQTTIPATREATRRILTAFLARGWDINSKDPTGVSLIHCIGFHGQRAILHELLDTAKLDLNPKDSLRRSPLHLAVLNVNLEPEDLALMVEAGADLRAKNNDGKTAAEYARQYNRIAQAEMLESLEQRLSAHAD